MDIKSSNLFVNLKFQTLGNFKFTSDLLDFISNSNSTFWESFLRELAPENPNDFDGYFEMLDFLLCSEFDLFNFLLGSNSAEGFEI